VLRATGSEHRRILADARNVVEVHNSRPIVRRVTPGTHRIVLLSLVATGGSGRRIHVAQPKNNGISNML
jgi:hypothetical protein